MLDNKNFTKLYVDILYTNNTFILSIFLGVALIF